MKKIGLLSLILASTAFGASIDHVQNYTAEYNANPAQQGAISQGTTVYFNPAGLMQLENGDYFVGGIQIAFGDQEMKAGGKSYPTELFSPIPNLALYRKTDEGALFWTFGAVGGGASLEYKEGIPLGKLESLVKNTNVKGSNQYAQTTFGKAFNINEKLSMSLALRGVYGLRTLEATTTQAYTINGEGKPTPQTGHAHIDAERTAYGFGGQLGLNYKASDRLNIGFRYDTKINLDFETDSKIKDTTDLPGKLGGNISNALLGTYPVYKDGEKIRRDLPALMSLGASYKVTDKWTTFVGGNYYFNEAATMDRVEVSNIDYDNGWEVSLGSEYALNEKVSWLFGANYAVTGAPEKSYSSTEYAIDSILVGTGLKIKQNETTEWTIAYSHYFYDTTSANDIRYSKEISSIGFNFTKKF